MGTNISKEPAAFIFRVEVTGLWMWLGCIHIGSMIRVVVSENHRDERRDGERDPCLGQWEL